MITIHHNVVIRAHEIVAAQAIGSKPVHVYHDLESISSGPFANVWSQMVTSSSLPVTLAIAALPRPENLAPKDLFSDQELRLCGLHNTGEHVVVVEFFAAADSHWRLVLPASALCSYHVRSGHLFVNAIDRVEIMPLTGPIALEILLGTQPTGV